MNIERQTLISEGLIGMFLCTQLPSEIPAWIEIEERVVVPGYWGQFDWHDEHIQALLDPCGNGSTFCQFILHHSDLKALKRWNGERSVNTAHHRSCTHEQSHHFRI
jgi:hypothetical protein